MDLSISIVSWNTREILDQCLHSVFATANGLELEVTVVDNASSDGTQEMLENQYSQVRLISNAGNVGFACANNQALAASSGKYFMLLNPDTLVMPGAFDSLLSFASAKPECGACGPMLLNEDGSLQPSWASLPSIWHEVFGRQHRVVSGVDYSRCAPSELAAVTPFPVGWLGGACILVRREVIDLVGPLDEDYFMYCEEADWAWRIANAGYRVYYVPQATVVHLGGQSSKQTPLQCQLWLQSSKVRLARKRFGPLGALPVAAAGWLRVGKSAASGVLTSRKRCS